MPFDNVFKHVLEKSFGFLEFIIGTKVIMFVF